MGMSPTGSCAPVVLSPAIISVVRHGNKTMPQQVSGLGALPRAPLCWVSSIFGLGLAWEVMGCAADDFPVRDGLKVGLHLSCMAKSEKSRHDKAQLGFAHGPLGGWGAPHAERA